MTARADGKKKEHAVMKFREYGEVQPMTIVRLTARGLDEAIEIVGKRYDIIDLQFSTAIRPIDGRTEYAALALVRKPPRAKKKATKRRSR